MTLCLFPRCTGHDDRLDTILHGLQAINRDLVAIKGALGIINQKEDQIMTAQDDVNTALAAIQTAVADLGTQSAAIQAAQVRVDTEIQALEAQVAAGQPVDTTALVAAAQDLANATSGLDATVTALSNDPNVPATAPAADTPATDVTPA